MKEKGFPLIESLMFDEHDMIKRAATECICNMVLCEEVRNASQVCRCHAIKNRKTFNR